LRFIAAALMTDSMVSEAPKLDQAPQEWTLCSFVGKEEFKSLCRSVL
jgi:hypothetical protein